MIQHQTEAQRKAEAISILLLQLSGCMCLLYCYPMKLLQHCPDLWCSRDPGSLQGFSKLTQNAKDSLASKFSFNLWRPKLKSKLKWQAATGLQTSAWSFNKICSILQVYPAWRSPDELPSGTADGDILTSYVRAQVKTAINITGFINITRLSWLKCIGSMIREAL